MTTPDYERQFWQAEAARDAYSAVWGDPDTFDRYAHTHAERIAERMPKRGILLDYGCGVGRVSHPVAHRLPEALVFGVDISARMIREARANHTEPGAVAFDITDGRSLRFPDEYFAGAWSMLVFQHLPLSAVVGLLGEFRRTLAPGAPLVVQYVPGRPGSALHNDFDHHHLAVDMQEWVEWCGFEVRYHGADPDFETWAWIDAERTA